MKANIQLKGAIRRLAVFRALNLGDMLCAVPGLRALRASLPDAQIALVGLESARPFVERYADLLDELILFPGHPAFPEQRVHQEDVAGFFDQMQARRFDLALQLHGSGLHSNEIVARFGARQFAGFVPQGSREEPGRFMTWPDDLPEPRRYLALLEFLGVPASRPDLHFPLQDEDRAGAREIARRHGLRPESTVILHPGARLASRRWPAERFAAVGHRLAQAGWKVAVTGSETERGLVDAVVRQVGSGAVSLCGETSLGELAGLLEHAALLICNDTGISHVAAAMRTPSVVIASGSDVRRWAPLDAARHRVVHHPMPCRPCAYEFCPIGHPCALAISVEQVLDLACAHLGLEADTPVLTGAA